MAKLPSKTPKVFASNAGNKGVVGSAQVGTKVLSNDVSTLQSLPAFSTGLTAVVQSGRKLPVLEEDNSLHYIHSYQNYYLRQEGVPEYDSGMNYQQYSIVKKVGSYELYGSKVDDNLGNSLSDTTKWQALSNLSVLPAVAPAITGFLPSAITGTTTTGAVSVSSGKASDTTNSSYLSGGPYSWSVSNGNAINGYQGGTTLPAGQTIHFFVCSGATGTGVFASTSLTPTLPSGYNTYFRRIFSLNTNGAGALIPGTAIEVDGGALLFYLTTQSQDINTSTQSTTRILYSLNVPTGFRVEVKCRANTDTSGAKQIIFTSGDEVDVAPTNNGVSPSFDLTAANATLLTKDLFLTTNTSGQIGARSNAASTAFVSTTRGFKDFRR